MSDPYNGIKPGDFIKLRYWHGQIYEFYAWVKELLPPEDPNHRWHCKRMKRLGAVYMRNYWNATYGILREDGFKRGQPDDQMGYGVDFWNVEIVPETEVPPHFMNKLVAWRPNNER